MTGYGDKWEEGGGAYEKVGREFMLSCGHFTAGEWPIGCPDTDRREGCPFPCSEASHQCPGEGRSFPLLPTLTLQAEAR